MSAREKIFAGIRRSLHVTGAEAPRRAAVEARLAQHSLGIIPARGKGDEAMRLAAFRSEVLLAGATIAEVASAAETPREIARYLRESNLPALLRMGDDARLQAMPWSETAVEVFSGPSDGNDLNAVSAAFAGVAESGTLALISGADNPTTLNFLPDNHIVVVFAEDVVGDYESVFARLRVKFGAGLPRAVNFITGPSRSADIEQTLLFGAHGPRRLHVVVVVDRSLP
jgi:L-lactate dehydrogenase complex protein LldG